MTGDPAWKEFERVCREKDAQEKDRLDAGHFRNFVLPILGIMQDADCFSELMWKVDHVRSRVDFSVLCSDTFAYACADAEPVETALDVTRLWRAYLDLRRIEKKHPGTVALAFLPELYAARRRKTQPLPAWLSGVCRDENVAELFRELPPNPITLVKEDGSGLRELDNAAVPEEGSPGEAEGVSSGDGNGEEMPGMVLQ